MNKLPHLLSLGIFLSLLPVSIKGQSAQLFTPPDSVARLELRYLHPFYESVDNQGLLSGNYDFTLSYPINNRWSIQASIPIIFSKYDLDNSYSYDGGYGGYTGAKTTTLKDNFIGNIMIGVNTNHYQQKSRVLSLDLQLYLPTAPHKYDPLSIAAGTNLCEYQKYLYDVTTIATKVTYASNPETGWFYSLSGGAQLLIGKSDYVGDDNDLYFSYALRTGYKIKSFAFGLDYNGIIKLTHTETDAYRYRRSHEFRDRMFDAINVSAHYSLNNFQPSIFYSVYTRNDLRDIISGTLGIKLAYRFAK